MTPRIFVGADALAPGAAYSLQPEAARHVAQVLRLRAGDALTLFTGTGGEYAATIVRIDRREVAVRVERHDAIERETASPVVLVQALIASDMMDLVVRKAVELGAAAIAPVQCARSQAVPEDRLARRIEHWRQVAIAACEQCGRNRVPEIARLVRFAEWLEACGSASDTVVLDAQASRSLASHAAAKAPGRVVVGPEGGLTPDEVRAAERLGAALAHLGRRVLRAETAAIAALATLAATVGDAR